MGLANNCELQEWQVEGVPAWRRPGLLRRDGHRPAMRKIIGQEFVLLVGIELELGVSQHAYEFPSRRLRDERLAEPSLPNLPQSCRGTVREYQRRKHGVRVQHDARRGFHFER